MTGIGNRPTALWTVSPEPVGSPVAGRLLRAYYAEVAGRYHGRAVTDAEIDEGLVEHHSDDLAAPAGVFLVARLGGEPAGCGGLRLLRPGTAELKRLYVRPEARGSGGGSALLGAVEAAARGLGAERVVLDTRHDLVEARALYARHGYAEVPAYNDDPYAEHWFAKHLG
ncbi:GNAT family N-acetyltransferase [Streptomyces sp. S07_1.15]|uniref:GNAT family N-acetyltransferase n=1 Tax=Streptomyces sp. S07_1.15 TaxID=2873925 RepID=UPI001D15C294|nr:GNAT family N-acetyltransferase [Streptomyces sp. S07_1.15]MCC3654370.1 GNAT family N-acetyltransferase [Streptomyces sp. S07_1.15]